ncbi:class I SAM-dependent methyltransferase [Methylosinus sp. Ce-a6]|uniref:class I SAM-dependent methyltransferase n=1 Tax=Methylosinus sp. Ce-a6 TaxID=2172005 RepID=UPI00135A632E|nr:class I SAM-dependent methyltransferase [Methylosinus sp. Ce-a6]
MARKQHDSIWSGARAEEYESENYDCGLSGFVLRRSHVLIEKPYSATRKFARVLEVGAGSGIHLRYVRHHFDEYVMTDGQEDMTAQLQRAALQYADPRLTLRTEDACGLSFADQSFDRLIATHVLEHLSSPHLVIEEWRRVLKPGGVLSIVLPCDPGLAWRLGRMLGPRAAARRRGLHYDYVMALEHINSITNLVAILRHHFANRQEYWWPSLVSQTDVNLIFAVNITI